jgi:ankyrin repeat protein
MEGLPKDVFEYLLTWLDPHALSNARLGSSRVYRACIKPIFQRNYVNAQPVIAWKVWMQEWFTASEYILLQQWVPVLLQRPDVWDCRTYWMTDDDDETLLYPLLCASRAGAPCITQLLASPGVDVIDQFYFDSAIVAAANAGNTMCLRILLSEPRAHINVENISEHALSPACRNGRLKVVEILLESRRRIPLRTLTQSRRLQSDALMAACSTGRVEIVSLLLRHPDIDVNGYYMDSAIGIAIDNMQIEVCRLLLQDKRLRVERQGSSLMAKALRTDCIELVELLMGHPFFNPYRKTGRIASPMASICTQNSHVRMLRFLLQHPLRLRSEVDKNPLAVYMAVAGKQYEMLELLLSDGAFDPTTNNNVALDLAQSSSDQRAIDLLMADPRVRSHKRTRL